ncbi:hypothetical protein, partial [Amycolatopsis sp. NPDC006125]|uniref:hypothetical protein n=1 Tax=Amycolatopsis sp. NPDC006125 TaxID=3156730 RepID=UPI0033AA6A96
MTFRRREALFPREGAGLKIKRVLAGRAGSGMTRGWVPRLTSGGWLGGHPVAFRFVHITLSQGRKVGMFGCRLAAWV